MEIIVNAMLSRRESWQLLMSQLAILQQVQKAIFLPEGLPVWLN